MTCTSWEPSQRRSDDLCDTNSDEWLEVIEGSSDVIALPAAWPVRCTGNGQEMVVEHAVTGCLVPRNAITTSPSDNQWAGGIANYLCIVRLEGAAAKSFPAKHAFDV